MRVKISALNGGFSNDKYSERQLGARKLFYKTGTETVYEPHRLSRLSLLLLLLLLLLLQLSYNVAVVSVIIHHVDYFKYYFISFIVIFQTVLFIS